MRSRVRFWCGQDQAPPPADSLSLLTDCSRCQAERVSETAWLGIVGVVGTLTGTVVGPWVQMWRSGRHEERSRLRDARASLYNEAIVHAQSLHLFRDSLADEDAPGRYETGDHRQKVTDALPVAELITARMWLVAPKAVQEGWEHLLWCANAVAFYYRENNIWSRIEHDPRWTMPEDDPLLVDLTKAIADFRAAVRRATGVVD
jgi:hypothetical protein